jgi:signal transduction histidine kinase
MLDRIRRRMTLGYVGIFALIFVLVGLVAAAGFWRELVSQQDELLAQEARNQAENLRDGENREILATGSPEFTWIALDREGRVTDADPIADSLGLPDAELAREALAQDGAVSATIRGTDGRTRVVSMPIYNKKDKMVGVIQYARSLRQVRETVNGLVFVLLPLGLGAFGLAALGGLYMSGRAVRPVKDSFERQRAFIADASHELKTPLTLIKADAEVVLYRGDVNPEDRKLIEHALAEADRMSAVLSDLLLVARLDAGKLDVSREPFDLAPVLSETAARFETRAASGEIELKVRAPGKLRARGDAARTGQILGVLLDNALRHAPPRGRIDVAAHALDRRVEVSVADTGPGVEPEHLPRIFDRFYRADSSRSRNGGGTGLGLSIARDLARAQGGDLTAENAKSGGAVFRLRLPKRGD